MARIRKPMPPASRSGLKANLEVITMSVVSISKESLNTIMKNEQAIASKVPAANQEVAAAQVALTEKVSETAPKTAAKPSKIAQQTRAFFQLALPPMFGILLLLAVWTLISHQSKGLPGPISTWHSAEQVFSDPFYSNGPNDQGIGWYILASLKRVALGCGLVALVRIPVGFIIGRFEFLSRM